MGTYLGNPLFTDPEGAVHIQDTTVRPARQTFCEKLIEGPGGHPQKVCVECVDKSLVGIGKNMPPFENEWSQSWRARLQRDSAAISGTRSPKETGPTAEHATPSRGEGGKVIHAERRFATGK